MNIIGFVLYHLLFMCVTLLVDRPYKSYVLSCSLLFFLVFLLVVPRLKLPDHHLWSYMLWTLTFLFQSFMWLLFFSMDGITHEMMYLFEAVWCTSLTFVVTGCSCFTILFGNMDWYVHLIVCLEQYWLFFQLVRESSFVFQVLPVVLIVCLRVVESIERRQVSWGLFVEIMSVLVSVYMTWFGYQWYLYIFVIVMVCLRFIWTSEYRICRMYMSEDQEEVIFDEWSDDTPIL